MKPKAATAEFDEMMGGYKSVDAALDKIASQVKFLNMVADHELRAIRCPVSVLPEITLDRRAGYAALSRLSSSIRSTGSTGTPSSLATLASSVRIRSVSSAILCADVSLGSMAAAALISRCIWYAWRVMDSSRVTSDDRTPPMYSGVAPIVKWCSMRERSVSPLLRVCLGCVALAMSCYPVLIYLTDLNRCPTSDMNVI
jgi:hypothetical protein